MNHPTEPLIRIDKGTYGDVDISGTTATLVDVRNPEYGYYLLDGPAAGQCVCEGYKGEEITAYRPCVAVPIGELVVTRAAFMGVKLSRFQYEVIQRLVAHTPKDDVDDHE